MAARNKAAKNKARQTTAQKAAKQKSEKPASNSTAKSPAKKQALIAAESPTRRFSKTTAAKAIQVRSDGGFICLDLTASQITESGPMRGLIMVGFAAPEADVAPAIPLETGKLEKKGGEKRGSRDITLERELQLTKESFQRTIEELETSNDRLKSTNEEMQSKIEELSRSNDEVNNLLDASDIATIFLDNDLCVKRFTHQATNVVRLIHSDVGRPLADIVSRLDYTALESDSREVLRTQSSKQAEVRSEDDTWYLMRIMPYRIAENVIDGLVITFVNINALRGAERALVHSGDRGFEGKSLALASADKDEKKRKMMKREIPAEFRHHAKRGIE